MLRPINAIIKDNVGNIIHRGFVVTGEVTKDNGNKSYDVKIAGEEKEYPRIFTLARNPDLAIGDTVRILYKNGCKELPIILPPVKPTAITPLIAVIVQQYSEDDYLRFYNADLILQNSYLLGNGVVYFETDCMAMDKQNNVYYIKSPYWLTKIDSNGNELLTTPIAGYPESIAIGADGYIYTREQDGKVYKRSVTDFSSQGFIRLTIGKNYYGLVLDEDGNMFTANSTDDVMEKWSSVGVKVASRAIADGSNSSLCLVPTRTAPVYDAIIRTRNGWYSETFRMRRDLTANEGNYGLYHVDDIPHAASNIGDYALFTGENRSYNCELELHKELGEWNYVVVDDSQYSPDNSLVAAYPF